MRIRETIESAMSSLCRRRILLPLVIFTACLVTAGETFGADELPAVSARSAFEHAAWRAKKLARTPFQATPELPVTLRDLDYDQYRLIAFEHAAALWKGTTSPFALEFFHRGYLFPEHVSVNLIEDGQSRHVPFRKQLFQYRGGLSNLDVAEDVGFAGFRVLGKFESSPHLLEIASFLGASYFRAIAEGQVYGTSARGLAIDIGLAKPEEFPAFREFWIERPTSDAESLQFAALLDSPSVAGAYQFNLRPGRDTVIDVKARLFFRSQPRNVGLAPLTSMWMWGAGRNPRADDRRMHVHDSDGLLLCTNADEWIWRPLVRLNYPSLSQYDVSGIRGFGLMQRERRPSAYGDEEAKYHLRPSVWIEPRTGWDAGRVHLLELPAEHEGIDNIAAWWQPASAVQTDLPLDLEYSVSFLAGEPQRAVARAVATRVLRRGGRPFRVEIDFAGDRLAEVAADAPVTCDVTAQRGVVQALRSEKQPGGVWRVGFDIHPAGQEPVELRALLSGNGETLTETWRYLCPN